ncbi:TRAP transporter small permease [Roseibium algae]|uniref:TRAP transporter small permease protein n=1 Tax=Roseibium algae TaxID=3123038 RepID=A0ABU8THW3_9HYPH
MINRFCDLVFQMVKLVMWIGFAALIINVGLQVLSRNVLHTAMIWTGDVAQLLFAWLIFLGAALGLRLGAHYKIDMFPQTNPVLSRAIFSIEILAGLAVAIILLRYGWDLAVMRSTAEVQSLGISRFWMFLPMPISGALMLLFLVETIVTGRKMTKSGAAQ